MKRYNYVGSVDSSWPRFSIILSEKITRYFVANDSFSPTKMCINHDINDTGIVVCHFLVKGILIYRFGTETCSFYAIFNSMLITCVYIPSTILEANTY